jgi:Urease, gamma subunit
LTDGAAEMDFDRCDGSTRLAHRYQRDPLRVFTPREKDTLLVSVAAMVAEHRLRRGVKLNYPEAVALIADYVIKARETPPFLGSSRISC